MQIKVLTAALQNCGDGICDYCVGCQALGKESYEDCLYSENRAKDFVLDFERVAKEFDFSVEKERETRHHDCPFCGKQWREYCDDDNYPNYCPGCGEELIQPFWSFSS